MLYKFITPVLLLIASTTTAQTVDWASSIGRFYSDRALSVVIDGQDNKYIGGHFTDTVDFDLGAGTAIRACAPDGYGRGNAFLLKLNAADNFSKVITLGDYSLYSYVGISSMKKDAAGNLLVLGYFSGTVDFDLDTTVNNGIYPTGGNAYFLLKLDANENFLWVKQWENSFSAGSGNGEVEEGPAMTIDASNNICIAGRYKEVIDFDPDTSSFILASTAPSGYVLKFDSNGDFLWVKDIKVDTAGASGLVYPRSISVDASGNFYVSGEFMGTADFNPDTVATSILSDTVQKGFLLKLTANGSFQWAKKIGGMDNSPIYSYNYANAVAVNGASDVLVAGSFMGTITMGSTTLTSNGYSDIFIAKLDASGNYIWAKSIGNTWDGERATRITLDASDNIYLAGTYSGTLDFNPGAGAYIITSNGSTDAYLCKLNTAGDFRWAKSFGGSNNSERIYSVAVNGNSVYTVGKYEVQMNCDNDGSYYIDASYIGSGGERPDGWIAKINQGITDVADVSENLDFSIYPNPAANEFVIGVSELDKTNITATLFNVQGMKVQEFLLNTSVTQIDVCKLQKGLYFLQLQSNSNLAVKKLLIE